MNKPMLLKQITLDAIRQTRVVLGLELERARDQIDRALRDLNNDKELDEHLLVNMSSITLDIMRFNTAVRNLPYLEPDVDEEADSSEG